MTSSFPVRALHVFLLACSLAIAPAYAADPGKTLHVAFPIAETSFDPAFASDAASDGILANIMEAMLDYDYLARPVKLVPRTLEAMPLVEENGIASDRKSTRLNSSHQIISHAVFCLH